MEVNVINGNLFTTKCKTLVNTVNCVGVMGAGLALEFRLRYPSMYEKYIGLCANNKISIGLLWLYKTDKRWVLNFPTKNHWKFPSKEAYLHKGLQKFVDTYQSHGINSIAFPLLGANKGGLDSDESLKIMNDYLCHLNIDIEIYRYDPKAEDDLYREVRDCVLAQRYEDISDLIQLRKDLFLRIVDAMKRPDIVQLHQLGYVKGIGIKTLEKIFAVAQKGVLPIARKSENAIQLKLNFGI